MRRLAVGALLLLSTAVAHAHGTDPDVVALRYEFGDDGVRLELLVAPAIFDLWFELRRDDLLAFSAAENLAARKSVENYLSRACPLEIDGARATPVATGVRVVQRPFADRTLDYVSARLHYRGATPRTVSIAWQRYLVTDVELDGIHAELIDAQRSVSVLLTPAEPQCVWHAPDPPRMVTRLPAEPPAVDVAGPWITGAIALLVATALLMLALRGLGGKRMVVYAVAVVGVVIAAGLAGHGWGEHVRPRAPPLPDGPRSEAIFEALLRGVYGAFEYRGEEAIYDALSSAVAGELLDRMYREVHAGLVTAEAGGAVARVKELAITDVESQRPEAGERYHVVCTWRVKGEVVHWGHAHQRALEYRARFGLRRTAEGWRIATIEVLEMRDE